jgi:formamidopyrimidine-DNA glycosylase
MLRAPAAPVEALAGRAVSSIERHGKSLLLRLTDASSPEALLRIHLGMTGQLVFEEPEQPAAKHTHLIFRFDGLKPDLRYRDIRRFGRIELLKSARAQRAPDAWADSADAVFAALRKRAGMLKHALLNQHVVAGLGNIYVDESLYRAKLHPKKDLKSLSDVKLRELCSCIRDVLKDSLDVGGTSFRNYVDTQGSRGGFKGRLRIYGKNGQPCGVCGHTIKKAVIAGRGTHFCPGCQRR